MMKLSKPDISVKRDSVEGLVAGMESNLRWVEKRSIEERQLVGGLLGGLQEAGNRATGFFGGLLGIGDRTSSTTTPVATRPATTAAPVRESTTTPAPPPPSTTEQITTTPPPPPPPVTTSAPPPPPPPAVTTSPSTTPVATAVPVQSPSRAPIAIPVTTPEAISQQPTSTLIPILESVISPSPSAPINPVPSPVNEPNDGVDGTTTAAPQLVTSVPEPSTVDLSSTLFRSTISSVKPEETDNPATANTLTQVSGPEGDRGNITAIVVSIVVIIFGSIAILTAAYFISQRYIRRRRLAEDGQALPPTPPLKPMKRRFAPTYPPKLKFAPMMEKASLKLGLSKNF